MALKIHVYVTSNSFTNQTLAQVDLPKNKDVYKAGDTAAAVLSGTFWTMSNRSLLPKRTGTE